MTTPTLQQTPRFRALDGLRGVAALLVDSSFNRRAGPDVWTQTPKARLPEA